MKFNGFSVFAKIRFAKFGLDVGVFGSLSLNVSMSNLVFVGYCDRYGPYVYVMYVCNFCMTYVSCTWQFGRNHMNYHI